MKRLYPMTDEERVFAEDHFPLVEKFLHDKRLPPDEYFDIVIFGFIEAVQTQFRDPCEIERQNFTALARICMKHAIGEDRKYQKREMRRGNPLSMDYLPTSGDSDDFSFHDIVPDMMQDTAQKVENQDLIDRVLSVATRREREAINLVCIGFEPCEVSEIMGIARDTGRTTLYHFRKKARAVKATLSSGN